MRAGQQRNQLLLGTFVHSKSKRELEIIHNAAIAVDMAGKIAAVEKYQGSIDEAKTQALTKLGWEVDEVEIHATKEGQFFFPGFIGTLYIHLKDSGFLLTKSQIPIFTPLNTQMPASLARQRS